MTISYAGEVPNGSNFGCFWKILWKWRGSVYKLVWRELIAYLCVYYTINFVYRYALKEHQQKIFDQIRMYSAKQIESIPMSFVLGFYVSLIVKRWWEQYRLLPWPDTLALFISAAIPNNTGNNETGRLMRRNIMRYMVLAYVITLQRISLRVKRRFPTVQHLVDAGLMLESERKIFELMNAKSPMSKYWMPLVWATNIINRARKDNLITSDHIVQTILWELSDIRRRLGGLIGYDTVCVPLVYTQVVTLVLYTYFIATLMGRQMVPNNAVYGDLYFPFFTVLQFIFYVGWLKVAEVLINPFGEDDDDIELNWLIDRHIKAAYMIVDEMHEEHPELLKDQYWEEVVPKDLPYTVASEHYRRTEPKGSAENFKVKTADAMYANIMPSKRLQLPEDVYADYESVDTPMVERRKNWFSRQITRMGSVRSSSTAYSSGGLFNRNRINSVYSNPEAGIPGAGGGNSSNGGTGGGGGGGTGGTGDIIIPHQRKMSLYDKFVNRKSLRAQRQLIKQNSKMNLNGSVLQTVPKNRPRIPTPDVTKESVEKENRHNLNLNLTQNGQNLGSVASGVALMASQMANSPAIYHQQQNISHSDVPVLGTLLLSPIKEMDSNSAHNTLQAGHPTTAALAQAVLPNSLHNAGFGSSSYAGTTNISTLSFPFAVTTTSDSIPGAISIVSMVPASSVPQITATHSDNDGNIYPTITSFPVTLSLPRVNSAASINELINNETNSSSDSSGLLTVGGHAKNNLSRNNSINKSLQELPIYVLERKYSDRIKSHDDNNINNSQKQQNSLDSPVSAPSTLKKQQKSDEKSGEVYV